jgi:hypothetical protein
LPGQAGCSTAFLLTRSIAAAHTPLPIVGACRRARRYRSTAGRIVVEEDQGLVEPLRLGDVADASPVLQDLELNLLAASAITHKDVSTDGRPCFAHTDPGDNEVGETRRGH